MEIRPSEVVAAEKIELLVAQRDVLERKLDKARKAGDSEAVKKAQFDLEQTQKGIKRVSTFA